EPQDQVCARINAATKRGRQIGAGLVGRDRITAARRQTEGEEPRKAHALHAGIVVDWASFRNRQKGPTDGSGLMVPVSLKLPGAGETSARMRPNAPPPPPPKPPLPP